MRVHLMAAAAVATTVALAGATAMAGPELVAYPEGYQDSFTHYATANRADERKQVVKIFANDVALASAKEGEALASGSVIVLEVYKAKLDADEAPVEGADGYFVPDALAAIAVMESRDGFGEGYAEEIRNGTWEYAMFKGDDHSLMERDYQPCFECHKPLHEADYLFSFGDLVAAAGG